MIWNRQKRPHRRKTRMPELTHEKHRYKSYLDTHKPKYVIGIDEVAWGSIAGPIHVACTVFPSDHNDTKIRDSKKITTQKARAKALELVDNSATAIFYGSISVGTIEVVGPGESLQEAYLKLADSAISKYPDSVVVIDGKHVIKGLDHPQLALPGADTFVCAVSAASIVAKATSDKVMDELNKECPEYEWYNNKGYATHKHIQHMRDHGVSKHHRHNIQLVVNIEKKHGMYGDKK